MFCLRVPNIGKFCYESYEREREKKPRLQENHSRDAVGFNNRNARDVIYVTFDISFVVRLPRARLREH